MAHSLRLFSASNKRTVMADSEVQSENQGRRGLQPSASPATSSAPEPTHPPTSFQPQTPPQTPKRVKRKPVTVPDAPSKRRRTSDNNGTVRHFLTDCRYGTHFEPHKSCHDSKPFRPLIFGEVKEIIYGTQVTDGKDMSTVATLNLGLPKLASHLVDTFFWNQLAELDYGMRRESADNDSEAHMLPFGDYIGPTGEPSDRIFAQIAFDCHIQRSLPSTMQFPSHLPSRSFSSTLKDSSSDFLTAKSSISAHPTSAVPYSAQSAAVNGSTLPSCDPDQDQVDPDYLDFEDFSTSSTVCDWRSISVGDFVVIVGELLRADYAHNDNFVRVYTITALALNIVV
ncbi:hypothetical protein B0H11DRAFT_2406684 [Mycena galericulata]|nr:hypothetical protein B0H11DRAFT_2406684 [Mycena galericulata]